LRGIGCGFGHRSGSSTYCRFKPGELWESRPPCSDHASKRQRIGIRLVGGSSPPSPTTHSRSNGDFPVQCESPRIGGDLCTHFISAICRLDCRDRFGAFVSALENCVSRRRELALVESDYARPLLVIVLSTCNTNREYDRLKALLAATRTSKGSRPCATSVCNTRSHAPQSWATNW